MNGRDYKEALNLNAPMAAARIVRRDRYTWPGGYALALVTVDGGTLCPECVRENFHAISEESRWIGNSGSGWKPAGLVGEAESDSGETCDHCGREIWSAKE